MKRVRILISKEHYKFIMGSFGNASKGITKAIEDLKLSRELKILEEKIRVLNIELRRTKEDISLSSDIYTLDNYFKYLQIYSSNRGFDLPDITQINNKNLDDLLKQEEDLSTAIRKNEINYYRDKKNLELKTNINFSEYRFPTTEFTEEIFRLDYSLYSYDMRSVFIFLSREKERIKLRTFKRSFINELLFLKSGDFLFISAKKNIKGFVELSELKGDNYG